MPENTYQGPSATKVPRVGICRTILSLRKLAHEMWHDNPFNERNKATERTVGVGFGGDR